MAGLEKFENVNQYLIQELLQQKFLFNIPIFNMKTRDTITNYNLVQIISKPVDNFEGSLWWSLLD
jgi:hypothetical protein